MIEITKITPEHFPPLLREIPDMPRSLYIRGELPEPDATLLCVVGSRQPSTYGKEVVSRLIAGLAGTPVVIVSGLAIGVDALAHRAALDAGLKTIAVPGSGLADSVLYPRSNVNLAKNILSAGGTLISEYEPDFRATQWSFPKRNRIMAGMSHATLLIEAKEKSGTLITARLALDYNRDVLAVPGPITNAGSAGTNRLIKDGAAPVTESADILYALGLTVPERELPKAENEHEAHVLSLLDEPRQRDELIRMLNMATAEAQALVSSMEIRGLIAQRNNILMRN